MKNIKLKMATKEQKKKFVYARKAIVISGEVNYLTVIYRRRICHN